MSISYAFLIVAIVLFLVGAFPGVTTRVNVVSLGLAAFIASILAGGALPG